MAVERPASDAAYNPESRKRANRALIEKLVSLWDIVPEQRFGQLVMNLSREPGGFADTWEWSHADWRVRKPQVSESRLKALPGIPRRV